MSNTPRNTAARDQHRAAIKRTKPACGICEGDIDYTLQWPDLACFVVDHIVPLGPSPSPERITELDVLSNKQAAHNKCNRDKWDTVERSVVLICGPAGAGKTTLAHSLGLTVFDLDDPHWNGSDALFRQAIAQLASNDKARAAVIRSAATLSARQEAANLVGATAVTVVDTTLPVCIERITARKRTVPSIKAQIAAAQDWWGKYEPGHVALAHAASTGPRAFVTARNW